MSFMVCGVLTQRMTFSMQARQKTWAHSVMQGCCISLRHTAQSSSPPAYTVSICFSHRHRSWGVAG